MALAIGAALLRVFPAAAQLANGAPAWFLISVQNANSSSALQFTTSTGTWSTSYNTLFLNCEGLFGSVSGETLAMEVGESAAGWETGAHYTLVEEGATTASDVLSTYMLGMTTTGAPTNLQAYIDNPGSSTVIKPIAVFLSGGNSTTGNNVGSTCCGYDEAAVFDDPNGNDWFVSGWWNSDTNALTGIELVPSSGNIKSGTCSLYGIQ
jgi:hypothetical protein